MNAHQREFIDQEVDRLLFENQGDGWLALRASVVERLVVSGMVSAGFARAAPLRQPRSIQKPQIEAIDIPNPSSPEAATPSA